MTAASGASHGLVPSTTTQTAFELDRFKARAARMRKSILTGARLHQAESVAAGFRGRWAMLTLTYREETDWAANHVRLFLTHVRQWLKRRRSAARFVWCLELTKRGRPHYHVLVRLSRGLTLPKPDKQGWWPHGLTRVEWARNAVGYVAKYASKATPEVMCDLPKGARTHGVGGLSDEGARELRWWKSPLAAREALGKVADIRKVLGGYADKTTGEFWRSPWHVYIDGAGRVFCWSDENENRDSE